MEQQSALTRGERDSLIRLETKMDALITEVKDIKDGTKVDIQFLKEDKISRAEAIRIQTDALTRDNDKEIRLRFIERYMWLALGALGVVQFILTYFHPFAQ